MKDGGKIFIEKGIQKNYLTYFEHSKDLFNQKFLAFPKDFFYTVEAKNLRTLQMSLVKTKEVDVKEYY